MKIADDNMINMKWTDIQTAVDNKAIVLLPLGVIEEHGPQLCLGTDIYTAQIICSKVKEGLEENGVKSIIAPPFYWGICQSTRGFLGSFNIRMETAENLVFDILKTLHDFGFNEVYGINAHGDIEQNILFMNSFKNAYEQIGLNASYCFRKEVLHHYGLTGNEEYICPVSPQEIIVSVAKESDVHGGDIETAIINKYYPAYVDVNIAKKLPAITIESGKEMEWILGGKTKEMSKDGYIGNPSAYDQVKINEHIEDTANRYIEAISNKRKNV
ncbi:MAG: creatininase family protein [Spirochaetes bacterium]|nr:creatininase family protein [Spirochaetota bacterium]MBN2772550.1 creatininase family protein [Spirochaetota bacterium]